MKFCGALFFFGGLLVWGGQGVLAADADCSSDATIKAAVKSCYTDLGLTYDMNFKNIEAICRDTAKSIQAFECALGVTQECFPPNGVPADASPDAKNARPSITYFCGNIAKIDVECYSSKANDVVACVEEESSDYQTTCEVNERSVNCYKAHLGDCKKETEKIMTTLYTNVNYLKPKVCDGAATGGRGKIPSSSATDSVASVVLMVLATALIRLFSV